MVLRVHHFDPKIGKIQYPVRYAIGKNKGCFGLFLRKGLQGGGNKSENCTPVETEEEMIELIHQGYYVRVKTETNYALVRLNLYIDGNQVT